MAYKGRSDHKGYKTIGNFEENRGQFPPWVPFLARARGFTAALTPRGALFALPAGGRLHPLRMTVEGAAAAGSLEPGDPLPGLTHHLHGNTTARWVRAARSFATLTREDLLPGVDLRWRWEGSLPAYDLLLAPGADPAALVLRFDGAREVRVEPDGSLAVATADGVLRHRRPVAWQETPAGRRPVAAAFEARGSGRAGFRIGRRDPALPLVVDPLVSYATFLGGESAEPTRDVAVAPGGSAFVLGECAAFPFVQEDALDPTPARKEALLVRLDDSGSAVQYATYFGGAEDETAEGLAVDAEGGAWIAGTTTSTDLPVALPWQGIRKGILDGFLCRLTPAGDDLVFSTYFGGTKKIFGNEKPFTTFRGVALAPGGVAVVVGQTDGTDLDILDPFQPVRAAGREGIVAGFSPEGELVHSSWLGGAGDDYPVAIAAAPDGAILVTGQVQATLFPLVGHVAGIQGTGSEAFLAKIAPGGASLLCTQVWGGSSSDYAGSVAVLPSGEVLVGGSTDSSDFPVMAAVQERTTNYDGAFLSLFSAAGDALLLSTWVGGNRTDVTDVAAGSDGSLFAVGTTREWPLPALVDPLQPSLLGTQDAFLVRIAPDLSGYTCGSPLGGSGFEDEVHVAAEDGDHAWVLMQTTSTDIPVKGAVQEYFGGGTSDASLQRITFVPGPPSHLTATPLSGTRMNLHWFDNTVDETGFEIQRRTAAGSFATVLTASPDRMAVDDPILTPLTTYFYRIRANRPGGPTAWSAEVEAATPDVPPFPPLSVAAAPGEAGSLQVSWTRASQNEDGFEVHRRVPGGTSFLLSVLPAGTTTMEDAGLLPARTYGYTVHAWNEVGSGASAETWGTTAGTFTPAVVKGTLAASAAAGKDRVKIDGTLEGAGALSPVVEGMTIRLGGEAAPFFTLTVPAASNSWRAKAGRLTWKSAAGTKPKVKLDLDPARGTFRLSVASADFAAAPAAALECWIACGLDAGRSLETWQESKPGSGKFRFPAKGM